MSYRMAERYAVPPVGTLLRSLDPRGDREGVPSEIRTRVVRVIEHELGVTGEPRRIRVENTLTERRTFLRLPIDTSRWHVDAVR